MTIIKVRCTHTFEFNTDYDEDLEKYIKLKGIRAFQKIVRDRFETNMDYAVDDVLSIDIVEEMASDDYQNELNKLNEK